MTLPPTGHEVGQNTFILSLPDYLFPSDPAAFFANRKPLELEIGSGDGGFMSEWARRCPETNFLGIERLLGRLRKLDRKAHRLGLENLRLLRIEAAYFLKYLLPPGQLRAMHIYFPDPWPKRKHVKNRLINEEFPGLAERCLAPGGMVYLRTDNEPYYRQMIDVFGKADAFEATQTPADLATFLTDFEKEFLTQGVSTRRAAYRKRVSDIDHGA